MNTEEQIVLQRMIEIYKPGDIDWMGTKIKKNNYSSIIYYYNDDFNIKISIFVCK